MKNTHQGNKDKKGKGFDDKEQFAFADGWLGFFICELNIITKRRLRLKSTSRPKASARDSNEENHHYRKCAFNLVGLSLSGGGIRSCLFNLGVLQEMSRLGLLKVVDIMSTVSGGGYIGGCLSSLLSMKRPSSNKQPTNGKRNDEKAILKDEEVFTFGKDDKPLFDTDWDSFPFRDWEPNEDYNQDKSNWDNLCQKQCPRHWATDFSPRCEMRHLRAHSNFLLPAGFNLFESLRSWGATTLHLMAPLTWFLCLITIFMLIYMAGLQQLFNSVGATMDLAPYGLKMIKEFLVTNLAVALESIWLNPWIFVASIVLYYCLGCLLLYGPFFKKDQYEIHHFWHDQVRWPIFILRWGGIPILIIAQVCLYALFNDECRIHHATGPNVIFFLFEPFYFFLACLVTTFLCLWLEARFTRFERIHLRSFLYIMAGTNVAMVGVTFFLAVLPIMIKTANLILYGLFQMVLAIGTRWLITSTHLVEGVSPPGRLVIRLKGLLLNMLVILIVVLFLVIIGNGIDGIVWHNNWLQGIETFSPRFWWITASVIILFLFLSYTDLNRISAHYFYGDRLAEAFLQTSKVRLRDNDPNAPGARIVRKATSMTLLDLHGRAKKEKRTGKEDVTSTAYGVAAYGPYHIISATLNLTSAHDLQGLKRRTEPFWFSRIFLGSRRTGYVSTEHYKDLELVRALTISGAAVSPVMGIYTNRLAAFACTLLGIRLGFWLPNPRFIGQHKELKDRPLSTLSNEKKGLTSKVNGIWIGRLLNEFTGNANAIGKYVYLSDGGHCGDNLGIVPLLKRRAKLIIASDAECDPIFSFNSLNNSLRNIYVDEGIKIDLNLPSDFVPNAQGLSARHFLVGRILYPDRPWQASWIVVLKSSLTGDELSPILNYKRKSPTFPHETTTDQFFTEEQFESYRALGRHIVNTTFSRAVDIANIRRLDQAWDNIDILCRHLFFSSGKGPHRDLRHRWDDLFTAMWDSDQIHTSPEHWNNFQKEINKYASAVEIIGKEGKGTITDTLIMQLEEVHKWLKDSLINRLKGAREEIPRDYRAFQKLKAKY